MVIFNVLELLFDETAMPRGMEVRLLSWKYRFASAAMFAGADLLTSDCCLWLTGPSPRHRVLLHVRLSGSRSASGAHLVSFSFDEHDSRQASLLSSLSSADVLSARGWLSVWAWRPPLRAPSVKCQQTDVLKKGRSLINASYLPMIDDSIYD